MALKTIQTSTNTVQVDTSQCITFQEGLYAFEQYKNFYLLEINDDHVFQLLQSEDNKDVAFIVVNPYLFKKDYVINVKNSELTSIGINSLDEAGTKLAVLSIISSYDDIMTANLLGPIILNTENKQARQALDLNENYTTKHNLLDEIEQNEAVREATGVSTG